jgi:hypothetical protein
MRKRKSGPTFLLALLHCLKKYSAVWIDPANSNFSGKGSEVLLYSFMKKSLLFALILFVFIDLANAQKPEIAGSWLLTRAEVDGEIQQPYFVNEFQKSGALLMMGIEVGTWKLSENSKTIVLESNFDKDFNGEMDILNLTEKELVLDKDGAKLFYQRLDQSEITAGNKNSGLLGIWEIEGFPEPELNTILSFKEPDLMTIIEKGEGYEGRTSGTWIFNQKDMSLLMIGLMGENGFNGENRVLAVDEETLSLENRGRVSKARRKVSGSAKIERLTFSEDEFFTADGDYKYEDEAGNLPWANWSEMKTGLLEVKELVYNYSSLIEGTETFDSEILRARVEASVEEEGYEIDFIFYGYDSFNPPDDAQIPPNSDYYEDLYPLHEDIYRIAGREQISTPAGTFDCTVVEAIGDSGVLKKLWMINDRVGIYARIIEEDPDENFGHYVIYELQEIKTVD